MSENTVTLNLRAGEARLLHRHTESLLTVSFRPAITFWLRDLRRALEPRASDLEEQHNRILSDLLEEGETGLSPEDSRALVYTEKFVPYAEQVVSIDFPSDTPSMRQIEEDVRAQEARVPLRAIEALERLIDVITENVSEEEE